MIENSSLKFSKIVLKCLILVNLSGLRLGDIGVLGSGPFSVPNCPDYQ